MRRDLGSSTKYAHGDNSGGSYQLHVETAITAIEASTWRGLHCSHFDNDQATRAMLGPRTPLDQSHVHCALGYPSIRLPSPG